MMTAMITTNPDDFSPQTDGLSAYRRLIKKRPEDLVEFLRDHPEECKHILGMSYDKRYTPSTFVEEFKNGYRVGWYSKGYQAIKEFETLAEAIADYLLFSFGKSRLAKD